MTFMVSITMATDLAQPLLKLNNWYWRKVIRAISRVCYLYFFLNRCCSWVHETLTLNLLKNHSVKGCYNMYDWNINSSTHRSENGQHLFLLWEHTVSQTSRLQGKKGMYSSIGNPNISKIMRCSCMYKSLTVLQTVPKVLIKEDPFSSRWLMCKVVISQLFRVYCTLAIHLKELLLNVLVEQVIFCNWAWKIELNPKLCSSP